MIKIVYKNLKEISPYDHNPRKNDKAVEVVANSIREFGFKVPIVLDKNNIIIAGHTRVKAAIMLGLEKVPCIIANDLNEEQVKAFRLADNKIGEIAEWDLDLLNLELTEIEMDMSEFGFETFDVEELGTDFELNDGEKLNLEQKLEIKQGDIFKLGNHYLMCGDSTSKEDVEKLVNGQVVDLVFTDPPYGMGKEVDGVIGDNMNYDDLLEFNKKWVDLSFDLLKSNGSWYCWGIDEPLMDIYSEIIKPKIRRNEATFRNLITWDKGVAQGQLSPTFKMYPRADEKCLFVMKGVAGFIKNADQYWEGNEPIRQYLLQSRLAMKWDIVKMKRKVGHSDLSRDHWTSKSQFELPTREVYNKLQEEAEKERKILNIENDAFKREYDDLKREYDDLKREYDDLRAYFDNTHEGMTNVWAFSSAPEIERYDAGNHATPKPLQLVMRAIKSSSRKGETVLDLFGGGGSTLIVCEHLKRKCLMMEINPFFCNVIINRYEKATGQEHQKISIISN